MGEFKGPLSALSHRVRVLYSSEWIGQHIWDRRMAHNDQHQPNTGVPDSKSSSGWCSRAVRFPIEVLLLQRSTKKPHQRRGGTSQLFGRKCAPRRTFQFLAGVGYSST